VAVESPELEDADAQLDIVEPVTDLAVEVVRQNETQTFPEVGAVLEPVGENVVPSVSAADAVATARVEMGGLVESDEVVQATLASFTDEDQQFLSDPDSDGGPLIFHDVLSWVITFSDVCVPLLGPGGDGGSCAGTELTVVVDATTGSYIVAYSIR
jgi:hypothetical protein